MYEYFLEKGFWCLLVGRFANLLQLAFTIAFSTFLLLFVNWEAVVACKSPDACQRSSFVNVTAWTQFSFYTGLVWAYCSVFTLYWLYFVYDFFFRHIYVAFEMRAFFRDQLEIQEVRVGVHFFSNRYNNHNTNSRNMSDLNISVWRRPLCVCISYALNFCELH